MEMPQITLCLASLRHTDNSVNKSMRPNVINNMTFGHSTYTDLMRLQIGDNAMWLTLTKIEHNVIKNIKGVMTSLCKATGGTVFLLF